MEINVYSVYMGENERIGQAKLNPVMIWFPYSMTIIHVDRFQKHTLGES